MVLLEGSYYTRSTILWPDRKFVNYTGSRFGRDQEWCPQFRSGRGPVGGRRPPGIRWWASFPPTIGFSKCASRPTQGRNLGALQSRETQLLLPHLGVIKNAESTLEVPDLGVAANERIPQH